MAIMFTVTLNDKRNQWGAMEVWSYHLDVIAWTQLNCPSFKGQSSRPVQTNNGSFNGYYDYYFGDERDAILFKLRW